MGGWGIRYDAQSAGSHPMTEDVKVAKLRPCRRRFTTWTRPVARGYRPRGRLDDAAMNVRQLIGKGVARRSTVPSAGGTYGRSRDPTRPVLPRPTHHSVSEHCFSLVFLKWTHASERDNTSPRQQCSGITAQARTVPPTTGGTERGARTDDRAHSSGETSGRVRTWQCMSVPCSTGQYRTCSAGPILRRSSAIGNPYRHSGDRERAANTLARTPVRNGDVKSGRWIVELHRASPTAPINDLRCTETTFRSDQPVAASGPRTGGPRRSEMQLHPPATNPEHWSTPHRIRRRRHSN